MRRLWTVTVCAKAWGVTPFQAARELDEDPEVLNLICLSLLSYSEVKAQFDAAAGDMAKLKHLEGNDLLSQVRENAFRLRVERVTRAKAARAAAGK